MGFDGGVGFHFVHFLDYKNAVEMHRKAHSVSIVLSETFDYQKIGEFIMQLFVVTVVLLAFSAVDAGTRQDDKVNYLRNQNDEKSKIKF